MDKFNGRYVLLALILLFAFHLNFTPHSDYQYPVHVDEWFNFATTQSLIESQNIVFTEPFIGEKIVTNDLEVGLHLFLAAFKGITGISWLAVVRYLPSVIFVITILCIYIFAERGGYGLYAAFLASMIPTTVRLIGPGFLVAVALGLMFIPLILFIGYYTKKYELVAIFIAFLFLLHPPTALGVMVILTPYIILNYRKDAKHSIYIIVALIVGFLVVSPRLYHLFVPTAESLMTTSRYLPMAPEVFRVYGYLTTAMFVVGVFVLMNERKIKGCSMVAASMLILLPIVIYARYDVGNGIIYSRNYSYLMILMSIIGGSGLAALYALMKGKFNYRGRGAGKLVYGLLLISLIWVSGMSHASTPYYHIIGDREYQDFIWIRDNLQDVEGMSVLKPWLGKAYVPISGRFVYSYIPAGPSDDHFMRINKVNGFFKDGGVNSTFLTSNNISIVYAKTPINNSDLLEVKPRIYVLRDALS